MQPTNINTILKSGVSARIELRRRLGISASELELLEVIAESTRSLSQIAALLGMSKEGVNKAASRLIEKSFLVKSSTGKLLIGEGFAIQLSTTKTKIVELSTTIDCLLTSENVPLSTTNGDFVQQITTISGENKQIVQQSTAKLENVVQSGTNDRQPSRAHTHRGSSILLINNFETLEEEKIKEKINPLPPDKKENQKEEIRELKVKPAKTINIPFDDWWNAYQKKVDRSDKLIRKWERLTDHERTQAMQHTAAYVKATPDKKYRKNPETYLNNKSFNNEIITPNGNNTTQNHYRNPKTGGQTAIISRDDDY